MKKRNDSYVGERDDILKLVSIGAKKFLDVGCSEGLLGKRLKEKNTVEVIGIEIDREMAKVAEQRIDRVIIGDIDEIDFDKYLKVNYFDCVIFADILEHLRNPWKILKNIRLFLKDDGVIIVSVPNIRHYTTIFNLIIKDLWPYNERGIHDKNHLRFFTLKSTEKIFQDAGFEVVNVKRNYRIIEKPNRLNKFSRLFSLFPFKNFFTFQYLITFKKTK